MKCIIIACLFIFGINYIKSDSPAVENELKQKWYEQVNNWVQRRQVKFSQYLTKLGPECEKDVEAYFMDLSIRPASTFAASSKYFFIYFRLKY